MELINSWVYFLIIPIVLILIVSIYIFNKKDKYKDGIKVANTTFIKNNQRYINLIRKYKIGIIALILVISISILSSLVLLSRPVKIETKDKDVYNRDIVLCMDISLSIKELNLAVIDNLKKTVKTLKGDRFAISYFNSSNVTATPLTDDYVYVNNKLDKIKKVFIVMMLIMIHLVNQVIDTLLHKVLYMVLMNVGDLLLVMD